MCLFYSHPQVYIVKQCNFFISVSLYNVNKSQNHNENLERQNKYKEYNFGQNTLPPVNYIDPNSDLSSETLSLQEFRLENSINENTITLVCNRDSKILYIEISNKSDNLKILAKEGEELSNESVESILAFLLKNKGGVNLNLLSLLLPEHEVIFSTSLDSSKYNFEVQNQEIVASFKKNLPARFKDIFKLGEKGGFDKGEYEPVDFELDEVVEFLKTSSIKEVTEVIINTLTSQYKERFDVRPLIDFVSSLRPLVHPETGEGFDLGLIQRSLDLRPIILSNFREQFLDPHPLSENEVGRLLQLNSVPLSIISSLYEYIDSVNFNLDLSDKERKKIAEDFGLKYSLAEKFNPRSIGKPIGNNILEEISQIGPDGTEVRFYPNRKVVSDLDLAFDSVRDLEEATQYLIKMGFKCEIFFDLGDGVGIKYFPELDFVLWPPVRAYVNGVVNPETTGTIAELTPDVGGRAYTCSGLIMKTRIFFGLTEREFEQWYIQNQEEVYAEFRVIAKTVGKIGGMYEQEVNLGEFAKECLLFSKVKIPADEFFGFNPEDTEMVKLLKVSDKREKMKIAISKLIGPIMKELSDAATKICSDIENFTRSDELDLTLKEKSGIYKSIQGLEFALAEVIVYFTTNPYRFTYRFRDNDNKLPPIKEQIIQNEIQLSFVHLIKSLDASLNDFDNKLKKNLVNNRSIAGAPNIPYNHPTYYRSV
jgi:hypothetical protein